MEWLLQNLVSSVVYAVLALGGGIVLAVLKKRASNWFSPVLYGLCACGLIAISILAFVAFTRIPKEPERITPENIETNIRVWFDHFGISTKRDTNPNAVFSIIATLDNKTPVQVARLRACFKSASTGT